MSDAGGGKPNFDFNQFLSSMKLNRGNAPPPDPNAPQPANPFGGTTGRVSSPTPGVESPTGRIEAVGASTDKLAPQLPGSGPGPLGPPLHSMPIMQSPPDISYGHAAGISQTQAQGLPGAPMPNWPAAAPLPPGPAPPPYSPAAGPDWPQPETHQEWQAPEPHSGAGTWHDPKAAYPDAPAWPAAPPAQPWEQAEAPLPGWEEAPATWPAQPEGQWSESGEWPATPPTDLPDWNGNMPGEATWPGQETTAEPAWTPPAPPPPHASDWDAPTESAVWETAPPLPNWDAEAPAWQPQEQLPAWDLPVVETPPLEPSWPTPDTAQQWSAPPTARPPLPLPAPVAQKPPHMIPPPIPSTPPAPVIPAPAPTTVLPSPLAAPTNVPAVAARPVRLTVASMTAGKKPGAEALDTPIRPNLTLRILLDQMMQAGASDLHLSSGVPPCLRLQGDIQPMAYESLQASEVERMLLPVLSEQQLKTFTEKNDIDFALELPGLARFRVNFARQYRGMYAVMRIIPKEIPRLADLNLPPVIESIAKIKRGLAIVTGPTGSGKSTTLAAMLNEINLTRQSHIITIEDPIEFVHESKKSKVTHREVGQHASGFADAIRAAVREDPDIILVGEMRDLDTVSQAVRAAEMGLLVLATLHTNNASKAVDRIIDIFPAEDQEQIRITLSEALRAVVAQQLLKRSDGKGRIAVHEILIGTPALSNLIREAKTHQIPSVIQTGRDLGMQLMDQGLIDLIQKGIITPEIAREKVTDPRNFQRAGINLLGD